MSDFLIEWLGLLLRWAHVVAAIAWIGHAFLFHTLENGLRPPEVDDVDKDVHGELWMVHGGGFFRLQKTRVLPGKYTGHLHWFFHEAGATWISGFLLLIVTFYLSGSAFMVDKSVADIPVSAAMGIGLGTLVVGWIIYDQIWVHLGRNKTVGYALSAALIFGASVGLCQVLPGRAAFIHVGALMGTIMSANVFMRIIPGSRKMVAALEKGLEPDLRYGQIGHQRSVHNGYFHLPVIFIMVSNHFPTTYAHDLNWLVLILFSVLGAGIRQLFYDGSAAHLGIKASTALSLLALIGLTAPIPSAPPPPDPIDNTGKTAIDAASTGAVKGVISFDGTAPPPAELKLYGGCEKEVTGPVFDDSVLVADGNLQNVFVWVKAGWEDHAIPDRPDEPVIVDQRGCIYTPRIHGVRVGQVVTFVNSDPMYHNVRSVSEANDTFNINMPQKDQREDRVFLRPETMVEARCDVHPWMKSHIGVVPHDWWSISGADGAFEISGLPAGDYTLEAWHEVYGAQTAKVTVAAKGTVEAGFRFAAEE